MVEKIGIYPYASQRTLEFLKDSISEGAHLRVPESLRYTSNPESTWVQMRNVAGIYFSAPVTFQDLGRMYGYKSEWEGPRIATKRFLVHLRENGSEEIKQKYPLKELRIRKVRPEQSRKRTSYAMRGKIKVAAGEIRSVKNTNVKDFGTRQVLLNEMGLTTVRIFRNEFADLIDACKLTGYEVIGEESLEKVANAFKRMKVPVGFWIDEVTGEKLWKILKDDYLRLKLISKNPS